MILDKQEKLQLKNPILGPLVLNQPVTGIHIGKSQNQKHRNSPGNTYGKVTSGLAKVISNLALFRRLKI